MRFYGHRLHSTCLVLATLFAITSALTAQEDSSWRPGTVRQVAGESATSGRAVSASSSASGSPASSSRTLPDDRGQVWREYDIRVYTNRMADQEKPEQEIVDWILRETGTDAWFSDTASSLTASHDSLRVYHTPRIQSIVADIVDRFMEARADSHGVEVRLITVNSPDWRAKAMPMLRPVAVQTPGVEAWLLSKENAALLLSALKRRTDFREHNSPNLTIRNGQADTISSIRPRPFTRGLRPNPDPAGGYLSDVGQIEEGYRLYISPLMSKDKTTVDAVVKCSVDQVERLTPLWLDLPNAASPRGRAQIQIPQISSWRLHERFRWPADEVLLISRGVVATPGPDNRWTGSLSEMFSSGAPRADALLLLEIRSETSSVAARKNPETRTSGLDYRGRY